MKRERVVFLSCGLSIAVVAAVMYFVGYSGSASHQLGVSGELGPGERSSQAQNRFAPQDVEFESASKSAGVDKHPSQTEHVAPERYSSNGSKPPWEKEIISLVNRLDVSDFQKAHNLLSRIPGLPEEGKVLAMEYATKLIPDEKYVELRSWIFQLAKSEELRETVKLDVLTRGETVRMPTLVEMIRQPANSEQAQEAREILVAYLDNDYGSDARQWETAVRQFLAANPEL